MKQERLTYVGWAFACAFFFKVIVYFLVVKLFMGKRKLL